jgi:1-acyl-sn-glycerol-3-phosphate acyltransferase
MIDQARLDAIHLHAGPLGQRIFGQLVLRPNYAFPGRRTRIVLEGAEHVPPGGGAVFVMNHTDRYNYWPFQFELWRRGLGFTATWVKGKYFENALLAWFMDACNNIPLPSRGYVLSKDFQLAMKRPPTDREYAILKQLGDGVIDDDAARAQGGAELAAFLARPWPDAPSGRYADSLAIRFDRMMRRVVEICDDGLRQGLNLLIFPQGTRSKRLSRGHTGAAQVILHSRATAIPVGCSGSDRLYPGSSPLSRGGTVTYRIGRPLTVDGDLARFAIDAPFTPFTASAERHERSFRALTDTLMDRINELVDPEYQYGDEPAGSAGSTTGAQRFL